MKYLTSINESHLYQLTPIVGTMLGLQMLILIGIGIMLISLRVMVSRIESLENKVEQIRLTTVSR